MSTETFDHTFEVESPARLRVSNVRGLVDIQPGDEGVIQVSAVKHNGSGSNGQTQINITQESDGLVVAEVKYENSIINWLGLNKPSRVDFTIRVPKTCSVKANSLSSEVIVKGLEGDFDIQGVSGDLQLSNLQGTFDFNSVSGKITADNLSGPLQMNSVSGKVRIHESNIPSIVGKTVSGSVIIETPLTEGPYEFKSVSGDTSLITPEDTTCTIRIKSVSGKAKVNLPVTRKEGIQNKQFIEVAGGGPEVNIKSVSGVLKIGSPNYVEAEVTPLEAKASQPEAVVQPIQPGFAPKSQMQILQEIEDGQLSVDDALKLMNP